MSTRFRRLPAIMYLDESGKVQPTVKEVNAVGAIAIPNVRSERDALTGLVGDLLEERYGDRGSRKHKLVVHNLTDAQVERVADTIRTRYWFLGFDSLEENTPEDDQNWEKIWNGMTEMIGSAKERVSESHASRHCERLLEVCEEMRLKHPLWTWFVFRGMRHIADCFRSHAIFPVLQVVLDEHGGHSRGQQEFLKFLTRFTFCTTFHEFYQNRLSFVLGVRVDGQFTCRTSTDDDDDGIHIANLVANATRRIRQGKDANGRIQRFFDRCSAAKWQASTKEGLPD